MNVLLNLVAKQKRDGTSAKIVLCPRMNPRSRAGTLREILPGGTKTDTGPPSFWAPRQNLYSLLV